MKPDTAKALLSLLCLLIIACCYYSYCSFKAERYNENLGTHYSPIDIMLGVEKTARDMR